MRNLEIKNNDCHAALAMTKSVQSGRSMIEMLGVLAIIGVLSVGGIAGYSKAMQKYRINKTIEQITLIAGNVRAFFGPQRNYSGLNNTILKKAKLVPDEMWNEDKTELKNVWSEEFFVYTPDLNDHKDLYIALKDIPYEACVELVSYDWRVTGATLIDNSNDLYLDIPLDINTATEFCEEGAPDSIQIYLIYTNNVSYYKNF